MTDWAGTSIGLVVLAVLAMGYLIPALVMRRSRLATAAFEDRFSPGLRVVQRGPAGESVLRRPGPSAGQLHMAEQRESMSGGSVQRPQVTPHAAQAAATPIVLAPEVRARRRAAARRRALLAGTLFVLACAGFAVAGLGVLSTAAWVWALGAVPTALLGAVLVAGRRAVKGNARRDAAGAGLAPATPSEPRRPVADPATDARLLATAEDAGRPVAVEESRRVGEEAGREWTPREVPRPTYALKARAPRMVSARPLEISEVMADEVVVAVGREVSDPVAATPSASESAARAQASQPVAVASTAREAETTLDRLTGGIGLGAGLEKAIAKRRAVGQ